MSDRTDSFLKFIEEVIMKKIKYCLFDVVVEFHREMITSQLQGKLRLYDEVRARTLFVLSSSNRGRLLGIIDLMRQKNKRMKQEGLNRQIGKLQDSHGALDLGSTRHCSRYCSKVLLLFESTAHYAQSTARCESTAVMFEGTASFIREGKIIMARIWRFIEEVVMKTIEYCLFDVVVEFHRSKQPELKRSLDSTSCVASIEANPPLNLNSLKNWNNHFFWIDTSFCPILVPWFKAHSVERDPLPSDDVVDLNLIDRLNEGHAIIKKCFEACWISFNPFNVMVGERTLAYGEVSLSKETEDMVISHSRDVIEIVDHTIAKGSSYAAPPKENPTITDREYQDESGSAQGENVRTRPTADRFIVISSSSPSADTEPSSLKSVSPTPNVETKAAVVTDIPAHEADASSALTYEAGTSYVPAKDIYIPNWDVTNDFRMDDPVICQNFFNGNAAEHECMVSELRLRYEPEIEMKEQFKKKFVESAKSIQQRDAEVANLKSKLEKAKGRAIEVIRLRESVCEDLRGEIKGEARMREEFMALQDAKAQCIEKQNMKLDAHLVELNFDMDTKLYPYMMITAALGKAISMDIYKGIQEGLEAEIEHGKAGRVLGEIEAYDSGVEARFVAAVKELENVSLPLLDQLEALKDSPLELLMSSLTLEGSHGEENLTPEFWPLQHASEQVTMLVYYECGGSRNPSSISHKILIFDALAASYSRAEKRKKDASLSLVVGEPSVVASGLPTGSLAQSVQAPSVNLVALAAVSRETSFVVADYKFLARPSDDIK
ncbi:hypothetical protein Tco_1517100 [Tanacetum coccineum]